MALFIWKEKIKTVYWNNIAIFAAIWHKYLVLVKPASLAVTNVNFIFANVDCSFHYRLKKISKTVFWFKKAAILNSKKQNKISIT